MPCGREGLEERGDSGVGQGGAAGENVGGGVAVLGPGVNREVALSDQHHHRRALRAELVLHTAEHGALRRPGRMQQRGFEPNRIVEKASVDAVQLDQQMRGMNHEYRFFIKKTMESRADASVYPKRLRITSSD